MDKISPKVSIVLPTYNGAKYIRQSIDSCLNQTYKNIELIIIDDCSTDETPEIIKSYKDDRLQYFGHQVNKGLPHALNTGFAKAIGEYLTWTSDDNYYKEEAIEKMLSFLIDKRCSFVYCDYFQFKDNDLINKKIVKSPTNISLEKDNFIGGCFLYTKNVMEVIGNYDPETALAEDYDYWIRISKKFTMCHLSEPLYFYRYHNNSLTNLRYFEVRIVDYLVRIKNDILYVEHAKALLVNLFATKYRGYFKLNILFIKILYSKKILHVLIKFKLGDISFIEAKLKLINMIKGD